MESIIFELSPVVSVVFLAAPFGASPVILGTDTGLTLLLLSGVISGKQKIQVVAIF